MEKQVKRVHSYIRVMIRSYLLPQSSVDWGKNAVETEAHRLGRCLRATACTVGHRILWKVAAAADFVVAFVAAR